MSQPVAPHDSGSLDGATDRMNRVMVCGVGAITALGPTASATWDGVKAGRVAIEPMRRPMDGLGTAIGGEVHWPRHPRHRYPSPRRHREPALDYALMAAEDAMDDAGIPGDAISRERWGVVFGTCNAGLVSGEIWYTERWAGRTPSPRMLVLVPPQSLAEAIGGAFGIRGPVCSVNTACAAGANAIGYAADLIRSGQADAVLAGGSDALSDVLFAGFTALESLSARPAAPFSRHRDGLSLGEGSGMLVLVREDLAAQLGLHARAAVAGYGLSADGYHPTAPHPEGEGAARAMRAALADADVAAGDVGYLNAHGTGTPKNDEAESRAIRAAFGPAADRVLVSSTKSQLGHLLGGAGAVEAIMTVEALQEQLAPPTSNYVEPDPACDLDYVPNVARAMRTDVAMTNNFAFGGANASVVLTRPGAARESRPARDRHEVVVTGMTMLTSAGCTLDDVWTAFATGRVATHDEDGARVGRVALDPEPFLTARERRRMDRIGVFGVVAAKSALADANLAVTNANRARIGIVFGTAIGPMEAIEAFIVPLIKEGFTAANPAIFPNTVYNAAAGQVAIHTGAVGPTTTVTTGHAAGAGAMAYAYDLVSTSRADAIVCIAADVLTDTVVAAYRAAGAFESPLGDYALSEGCVAFVLERAAVARERGASSYGRIAGYGIASDGLGVARNDPRGRGIERAMRLALGASGRTPADVSAIWANQSGHRPTDIGEAAAIRRVCRRAPAVHAPRLLFGDPIGAGGALGAGLGLLAAHRTTAGTGGGVVLVNSSSMGGTHISLVLEPEIRSEAARAR
jgi:3-oxoacyl-[acyl-carrier-protein] synthase II